jgi:hypothetical protein
LFFILKKNKKKWNSVLTFLQIPCKFQQNWPKKVAVGLNGLYAKYIPSLPEPDVSILATCFDWRAKRNKALILLDVSASKGLELGELETY